MRGQLKKMTALFLSVVMVMTLIMVSDNRVMADNVGVRDTVVIEEGVEKAEPYNVDGVLIVYGAITDRVYVGDYGKVTVGSTGYVKKVASGRYATLTNEFGGTISSLELGNGLNGHIENSGTITTLTVVGGIGTIRYDETLIMTGTSKITDFSCVYDNSNMLIINAADGAQIGNMDINMTRISSSSSGNVTITDSLEMSGAAEMPSDLKFNVESGTKITKLSETDKWYVYYGGKKYLFPTTAFSDKTISDLYNMTVPTDTIALDDLTVEYSAAETATDTFTISNTGMFKMGWKIASIPDFVELYDEDGTQLAAGDTVTLAGGESRTITVKAKTGNAANTYNGSIRSQIWTAEAASDSDNTLMSEPVINITLNVNKKEGSGTVTATDVYHGTPIQVSATSDTNDAGYVIQYKQREEEDTAYSSTEPVQAGEYTARAIFSSTDIFKEFIDYANFAILRKDGVGTVSVADVYYGEQVMPVATSETNGTDNVTYKYKVKGADDTTYTETKPTMAGEYTVQATFAKTEGYKEVIATDDFSILRKTGTGVITIPDICYGENLIQMVSSSTNGTDNVTIEYKKKGANDETYTRTVPVNPGEYTARATFAQTDIYNAVTATDDFVITYLEAPETSYSMSGNQGENDYYTSDVTILPMEGYLIADSLDGTYRKSLTISKSSDAFNIYLKKIETGQKTAGIQVPAIKIDADAPVILNAPSEGKVYGEQVELTIKDDNLFQIFVNGEAVEFTDNKAVVKLSSNLGEETYEIVCTDIAGNTSRKQIIVAAEWMKDRNIPLGLKVRLRVNYSYQLGNGNWQVEGDSTTYAGDSTFYVNNDGEYIFTKID